MARRIVLLCLLVVTWVAVVEGVKRHEFKTCDNLSFCKRNRGLDSRAPKFEVDVRTYSKTSWGLTAELIKHGDTGDVRFKMEIITLDGSARVRIKELNPQKKRYEVQNILLDNLPVLTSKWSAEDGVLKWDTGRVLIEPYPLMMSFSHEGEHVVLFNEENLLKFEETRTKPEIPLINDNTEDTAENTENSEENPEEKLDPTGPYEGDLVDNGAWEEVFKSHTDSKPNGPASVGAGFSFPLATDLYGLPEHTTRMSLKNTIDNNGDVLFEPYRLYNLDVFEYELDETMAIYGAVPLLISHGPKRKTAGVFWLNSAETWVDLKDREKGGRHAHWFSESGIIDFFVLYGPTPKDVLRQYAQLTGTTEQPPRFSLGYHQCRWNYKDEADVAMVDDRLDEVDIPMDVIWLDIEHTNGKAYYTWDPVHFPNPKTMIDSIAAKGRKMVTIVDPHIKKDDGYHIYSEAKSKGYFIKNKDGEDFEGHCWPGASMWLDFTNPEIRDWWSEQYAYDTYQGSTPTLFVWNDMNDPSVFSGPEITMPKDNIHFGGVEHRDVHNLYGTYMQSATAKGLVDRNDGHNERPFVLSRSFFAGTQRYGAIWTGDNKAEWSHLEIASPMLLGLGLAGITFSGADVGGFFGNPEPELLTRWYQSGAFYPFFRAHAELGTKRREPYLYDEPYLSTIRNAIRTRYALLPYYYTLFHQNSLTGEPVLRPLWVEYPHDSQTFKLDDQFLIGKDLLVKPVASAGQTSSSVYLPGTSTVWYEYFDHTQHSGSHEAQFTLDKIPVYQRGGSIIPRQDRARRSSSQMALDPFTLVIALDRNYEAQGELYWDDGHSYNYQQGQFFRRRFSFKDKVLTSTAVGEGNMSVPNTIERIVICGGKKPERILMTTAAASDVELEFYADSNGDVIIRKPDCNINKDFTITVTYPWF
eukprot:TRINITY_DN11318_c0_g1_i1.p1 TRINITY_DN11318_c0_g1~~TRINITY_DN11318_c0_g1_i1.p1  ORF type:complete len:921 (-),score=130.25 TRINITY_DN11318_c0_g1_i1:38-2800(-)